MTHITHIIRKTGVKKTENINPDLVETVRQTAFTDKSSGKKIVGSLVKMEDGTKYWCPEEAATMRRELEIIESEPEGSPTPPELLDLASRQAPGSKTISVQS